MTTIVQEVKQLTREDVPEPWPFKDDELKQEKLTSQTNPETAAQFAGDNLQPEVPDTDADLLRKSKHVSRIASTQNPDRQN